MKGPSKYIATLSPDRWERWREDWVLVQTDTHDAVNRYVNNPPCRLGAGPWLGASFQPSAREDPNPGRERTHIHDGAARLCVKVHYTPLGPYLPGVALHRGE
jgi:hypothetical protein